MSLVASLFEYDLDLESFIIDSEIIAVNTADGSIKSFQELSNRARKDVSLHDIKIAVSIFAFDIMYLDGEVILSPQWRILYRLLN